MGKSLNTCCSTFMARCSPSRSGFASLEAALQPDIPFTLSVDVCFEDVQQGTVFSQEDFFRLSLQKGELCLFSDLADMEKDCRIILSRVYPEVWYTLTLLYDGMELSVYIRGRKAGAILCSSPPGYVVTSHVEMGEGVAAYFRSLLICNMQIRP